MHRHERETWGGGHRVRGGKRDRKVQAAWRAGEDRAIRAFRARCRFSGHWQLAMGERTHKEQEDFIFFRTGAAPKEEIRGGKDRKRGSKTRPMYTRKGGLSARPICRREVGSLQRCLNKGVHQTDPEMILPEVSRLRGGKGSNREITVGDRCTGDPYCGHGLKLGGGWQRPEFREITVKPFHGISKRDRKLRIHHSFPLFEGEGRKNEKILRAPRKKKCFCPSLDGTLGRGSEKGQELSNMATTRVSWNCRGRPGAKSGNPKVGGSTAWNWQEGKRLWDAAGGRIGRGGKTRKKSRD